MTARAFPQLPGCGRPATSRIEMYSPADGRLHGSLDGAAYACREHADAVRAVIADAGFTSFTLPRSGNASARCGGGVDYTGSQMVLFPAPVEAECAVNPDNPTGQGNVAPNADQIELLRAVQRKWVYRGISGRSWYRSWSNEVTIRMAELETNGWIVISDRDGQWNVSGGAICAEFDCAAWVSDRPESRCAACTELFCGKHLFATEHDGYLCGVDYANDPGEVAR